MMSQLRSAAVLTLTLALTCAGCGHVIQGEFAPNHPGKTYDFAGRKCDRQRPGGAGPDEVFIRYLGAGGLYLEWRGTPVLFGPFFSNPSFPRALLGRLAANQVRIEGGLKGMDLGGVKAIFVGHAHYDHLADVPFIVESFSPDAKVYVNQTGANMLAKVNSVQGKVRVLEHEPKAEVGLIRVRAVKSKHAPLFWGIHWARGEVGDPWKKDWTRRRFRQLKGGTTFAFVIDLLDDLGAVRYRIYYQDSASPEGEGVPAFEDAFEPGYDLAVLCMASFKYVKNHPGGILDKLRPRHVLVTHYENFSRDSLDPDKPLQFVTLLTNRGANKFLGTVRASLSAEPSTGPVDAVCGPSSPVSTMPLPGEWLRFRAARGKP
ncbi:MAG TPA: MBL fold metallo-hydrolase [Thermoanaerobaculia bacterium]|nr:MBL fold metallo-hydrolase [Thermoanaerobaculia bacterium]